MNKNYFCWYLWLFGKYKVPLIGWLKPRLLQLDDKTAVIKIKLRRRARNHLGSMYFGALAIGADLAGGLHSVYYMRKYNYRGNPVFKHFQAEFLKRAESDVYFVCDMGDKIGQMVKKSAQSATRAIHDVKISAWTNWPDSQHAEKIADFTLGLSVRCVSKD